MKRRKAVEDGAREARLLMVFVCVFVGSLVLTFGLGLAIGGLAYAMICGGSMLVVWAFLMAWIVDRGDDEAGQESGTPRR